MSVHAGVKPLPILRPHVPPYPACSATDPNWSNATKLLLAHVLYLYPMLSSKGIALDALGVPGRGGPPATDPRAAWRLFAANFHLFRGTPSRMWLDHVFADVFGFDVALDGETADHYYDGINKSLASPAFRPRALFDRFNIELLATTEGAHENLDHHAAIRASGWRGRVVTTYRPDAVVDPEHHDFAAAMRRFGELTGEDVERWQGYLAAHRKRRAAFRAAGATATEI